MTAFELDTSGVVTISRPEPGLRVYGIMAWSDLSPFEQGFTRAGLESYEPPACQDTAYLPPGFSSLHPATLARFLNDCERFRRQYIFPSYHGPTIWREIQAGEYLPYFSPYRLSPDPDGKIIIEEDAA